MGRGSSRRRGLTLDVPSVLYTPRRLIPPRTSSFFREGTDVTRVAYVPTNLRRTRSASKAKNRFLAVTRCRRRSNARSYSHTIRGGPSRTIHPGPTVSLRRACANSKTYTPPAGLRARDAEHARGRVDSRDPVPALREDEGVAAGAAPEVEDRGGSTVEEPPEDILQKRAFRGVVDVLVQEVVVLRNLIEEVPRHDRASNRRRRITLHPLW